MVLPRLPRPQAQLQAEPGRWFSRWTPGDASNATATDALTSLTSLMGTAQSTALALQWPVSPATEPGLVPVQAALTWWRAPRADLLAAAASANVATSPADNPNDNSSDSEADDERLHRRLPAATASGQPAPLALALAARSGWQGRWLAARLAVQDAEGRWHLHFVAPNNPR